MGVYSEAFVGIDVVKERNAIAIAEDGRDGEIRYLGEVSAAPDAMRKVVTRLAAKYKKLHFCYEAGPTGYGLHRLITSLGHACTVVAPSLIPGKPGDRVKTNRRDAVGLARLLRAGELTAVWVPDAGHEAMRDLVRARSAAVETLRVHRPQPRHLLIFVVVPVSSIKTSRCGCWAHLGLPARHPSPTCPADVIASALRRQQRFF